MDMFECCVEIRSSFSQYLDGECERETHRSVQFHLNHCVSCREELLRWQEMQAEVRSLPHRSVPPQLALKLRVGLSQVLHNNLLGRLIVRFENALQPLLLPASAGILTAVICFGMIMGSGAPVESNTPDVPMQLVTPPRVQALWPLDFNTGDQPLVVVTHIDASGRVTDYQVLSGQHSPELTHRLNRMMCYSLFRPATMSGKPTNGRMVLSLRRITVRG
jgi:hypothetical protein